MRLELFGKDISSLRTEARTLVNFGARGLNIPHKSKEAAPLASLKALQEVLPPEALSACVPHYSLKFAYDRSPDVTSKLFTKFCADAAALPTPPRELLLVSGSGSRQFDSLQCLRSLPMEHSTAIGIGVAFNPFFPSRADREKERARLKLKVGTGHVSSVWLQLGSDMDLLSDALRFLEALSAEKGPLRLYGSVFLPSKALLARMRFRPWNGVFLDEIYLSSVESAEAITRQALELYSAAGVTVLVETAIKNEAEWAHAQSLLAVGPSAALPASTADQAAAARLAAASATATASSSCSSTSSSSAAAAASAAFASASSASNLSGPHDRPAKRARSENLPAAAAISNGPSCSQMKLAENCREEVATAAAAVASLEPTETASSREPTTLVWFRSFDLRCADHGPLHAASQHTSAGVVPAFVWAQRRGRWAPGGAAQAWMLASLAALDAELSRRGSGLILRLAEPAKGAAAGGEPTASGRDESGGSAGGAMAETPAAREVAREAEDTARALVELVRECGATRVTFHRGYEPELQVVERRVCTALQAIGCECVGFAGHLLYDPQAVTMQAGFSGGHWGTLMPFLRACERSGPPPPRPLPAPASLRAPPKPSRPISAPLAALGLAAPPVHADGSSGRDWASEMLSHWDVSEPAALSMMHAFVRGGGLAGYESKRSRADERGTVSSLSPYLRFGQLSPRSLYHAIRDSGLSREQTKTFSRRLHWRDLAYYQLATFPEMPEVPIRLHYQAHKWSDETPSRLRAWRRGMTGYPMVDAGMRALYATGWMHQSVRMVCASFLVEYLGVSWVHGQPNAGSELGPSNSVK